MPGPACRPVRTVLDTKNNAMSIKTHAHMERQAQKQRLGANLGRIVSPRGWAFLQGDLPETGTVQATPPIITRTARTRSSKHE